MKRQRSNSTSCTPGPSTNTAIWTESTNTFVSASQHAERSITEQMCHLTPTEPKSRLDNNQSFTTESIQVGNSSSSMNSVETLTKSISIQTLQRQENLNLGRRYYSNSSPLSIPRSLLSRHSEILRSRKHCSTTKYSFGRVRLSVGLSSTRSASLSINTDV